MSNSRGFSLFEVLIALGVFAIAVMGLALALESTVQSAFEARDRSFAREQLDSRLAYCLANPPTDGKRVVEARDNNGVRIEETLVAQEIKTTNNTVLPGMWKLTIVANWGERGKESADILLYRP
jgi:prepilin-type N-terminal cleavage/methylation domain-containing protein